MKTFKEWASSFETYLDTHMPFPLAPENLYEPGRYFLGLGGKRVRPVMCLMGCELFSPVHDDAWKAAMAIELFHNFTLIHDDMMDHAPLRRGKPTVHTYYGDSTALLSGDVMNIYAFEQLAGLGSMLGPVLRLFVRTAREVCEGQQMDMDFEQREVVSLAEYEEMIRLKTAVLLGASMQMGAMIGGASEGAASRLYTFGQVLGMAFQIRDDYLDAFGNGKEMGKQTGGDIRANKKTFLWIRAMERADADQRRYIQEVMEEEEEVKVREMTRFFVDIGAAEECRLRMEELSAKAFQCLESVPVQSDRKQPLRELTEYLLNRKA